MPRYFLVSEWHVNDVTRSPSFFRQARIDKLNYSAARCRSTTNPPFGPGKLVNAVAKLLKSDA
jgi:hypothetical protein